MKLRGIWLALFLAACGGGGGSSPPPPLPSPTWQFAYSQGVSGSCDNFDFPQSDGAHYCIRQMGLSVGQTLTMTFTLSGNGTLYPTGAGDIAPATIHLFMQRRNDDLSCVGEKQQYRWWAGRLELTGPGTYTIRAQITPDNWSDCRGISGGANPGLFADTVNNLAVVGYTFGGAYFAGHGAAANGPVHFTLNQFSTTQGKRKK